MRKLISYALVFVLGFGACVYILRYDYSPGLAGGPSADRPSVRPSPPIASVGNHAVADAAAMVGKSVVSIDTLGRPMLPGFPAGIPDFLGIPFGTPQPVIPQGRASGVIIRPDGYIVTNNHVVQDTQSITIILHDGRKLPGRVVGTDPKTVILAVIRVNAKGLPAAQFGDANTLAVGDWVIAIGNPLDLGPTVTVGVVSATRRTLSPDGRSVLEDAIQTDAAINKGNSGGALADITGKVVGINTAIASTSPGGGSIGIGFAIQSNTVKRIANELIERGRVVRPWVGIGSVAMTSDIRDTYASRGPRPPERGAVIAQVAPGSPAERAGADLYDIILEINRKQVKDPKIIGDEIRSRKVGEKILLLIWRDGQTRLVTATLGEAPANIGQEGP